MDAARRTADIRQDISGDVRLSLEETAKAAKKAKQAVREVEELIDGAVGKSGEDVKAIAQKAHKATTRAQQAADAVQVKVDETLTDALAATEKAVALDEAAAVVEGVEEVLILSLSTLSAPMPRASAVRFRYLMAEIEMV